MVYFVLFNDNNYDKCNTLQWYITYLNAHDSRHACYILEFHHDQDNAAGLAHDIMLSEIHVM